MTLKNDFLKTLENKNNKYTFYFSSKYKKLKKATNF